MRRTTRAVWLVALAIPVGCSDDDDTTSVSATVAATSTTFSTTTSTQLSSTQPSTSPPSTPPVTTMPTVTATVPATAPAVIPIRIVSQNILRGRDCAPETAGCQLADRIGVFMQQLSDAACPEVVAVEEANAESAALFAQHLGQCGYQLVWDGDQAPDRELLLTTQTVVSSRRVPLAGGMRDVFAVRLDTPLGAIDLLATHLASLNDNGPCDPTACPPPCDAAGMLRECQVVQLLSSVDQLATSDIVVLAGDFNAEAGEAAYQLVVDAGFVDSHLAAGHPECSADDPAMCTAGRNDRSMADMTDPASRQHVRIDYAFVRPLPDRCQIGPSTGPFNAEPAQGAIAYPSDHTGVMIELDCSG